MEPLELAQARPSLGSALPPQVRSRTTLLIAACAGGVLLLALCRAELLDSLPLFDNTEGRYASSSLAMTRSGDWITPVVHHRGEIIPFLGKPPLALWITSLSLRLFGVAEWAARLPSFLCGIAMLALTFLAALRIYGREVAWLSVLVATTSLLFYSLWGSVTLDVLASLCVTGAVVSFLFASTEAIPWRARAWGLGLFISLGLGMLAKGPVVPILAGGPILAYCCLTRRWDLLRRLPWLSGTLTALAIFVPWYVLAELHNPGFLRYFLIQENFLRYLTPNYGDLYGRPHLRPYGTIWLVLLAGTLPWPILLLRRAIWQRVVQAWAQPRDHWSWIFLFWGLMPAVFFTFATSVLPTYALPGIGGLAVLIARQVSLQLCENRFSRKVLGIIVAPHLVLLWAAVAYTIAVNGRADGSVFGIASGVALLGVALAADRWQIARAFPALLALVMAASVVVLSRELPGEIVHPLSTREIMAAAQRDLPDGPGRIFVVGSGEPSMQFYAAGLVSYIKSSGRADLRQHVRDQVDDVFVVRVRSVPVVMRMAPCLSERTAIGAFALLVETGACRRKKS